MNKQRKTSKSALKRKADKLFGEKIRSKGFCELAGKDKINCGGSLQTMHILGRSNFNLRWDEINAICGCAGHHRWYTSNPFDFYQVMQANFPERMEYLSEHRNEMWDKDIEKVLEELSDWRPL